MVTIDSGEKANIDVVASLLYPLRKGSPVVLLVVDPRLPKKKRAPKVSLIFTPVSLLGVKGDTRVLVSMPAYGSELIDTATRVKPMAFYGLGIAAKLSTALADAFNRVFRGEGNGI